MPNNFLLGVTNKANSETRLVSNPGGEDMFAGLHVIVSGDAAAIQGDRVDESGVTGTATGEGIGVLGFGSWFGMAGSATQPGGSGVLGYGPWRGVVGVGDPDGAGNIGVYGLGKSFGGYGRGEEAGLFGFSEKRFGVIAMGAQLAAWLVGSVVVTEDLDVLPRDVVDAADR
jgi:hypothetical protein